MVRILTIHGAKGLEFPIVALAKANTKAPNHTDPIADAETHALELKVGDFETPGWEAALEREKELQDAERKRLLYVACTRPRDHLIVPIVPAPGERKAMLEWLEQDLPEWDDEQAGDLVNGCLLYDRSLVTGDADPAGAPADEDRVEKVTAAELKAARAERDSWQAQRESLLASAGEELQVVTASSVERLWQRPLTVEVSEADGTVVSAGEGPPLPLGDAVHRVMEVVDLAAPGKLAPLIAAVCSEFGLPDREAEVRTLVERCLASPVTARALVARQMWREVPFTIPWEDGLAVGRMDMLFEEDGRLVIVDYKTDTVAPEAIEAAVESHRSQAEMYAAAATMATRMQVAEVVFVFARAGGEGACSWR